MSSMSKKMRILHKDALTNEDYSKYCYADTDKLLNHGGLNLIAPKCFDFAVNLTEECNKEMNETLIYERHKNSYVIARKNILSNNHL
mmetsp:Transcript_388/g.556  ORF Transcript_388/g.556 Transcript_388/m.556 type:complete len:87 (+) Transcript_388:642-902(+)